jgi:hypothetical protein
VDAGAADAHKDADVPGCPSRVLVALAVSACLVGFQLDQLLERGLVLRRAVDGSSRHDVCVFVVRIRLGGASKNGSIIHNARLESAVNKGGLGRCALHFADSLSEPARARTLGPRGL